jgi:hypothetical protein
MSLANIIEENLATLQGHYFNPDNNLAANNEDFDGFDRWSESLTQEEIDAIVTKEEQLSITEVHERQMDMMMSLIK